MSASHSRQSNGSDALKRAMSGSVWPVKRPPQSGDMGYLETGSWKLDTRIWLFPC